MLQYTLLSPHRELLVNCVMKEWKMEDKNYCSFSQCVLVSSPDQIFRMHPAALLKNRVSTPLLLKQGRNYTSVSSCCWTNQIAQGSKLCLTSSQIASLQIFWHQLKLKLLHTAALNTDPDSYPLEVKPHPKNRVWSTAYTIFVQVHRNTGTLFFSNLMLDVIEDCIPHCVPTIY